MKLSPTVREFADDNYPCDPDPGVMARLAPDITQFYHGFVTGPVWAHAMLARRAYNAYMILAMCREMSSE